MVLLITKKQETHENLAAKRVVSSPHNVDGGNTQGKKTAPAGRLNGVLELDLWTVFLSIFFFQMQLSIQ